MKSWLRIATAFACGFRVQPRWPRTARVHADRPQHAGARQRSAGVARRPARRLRAARDRSRGQPRPQRPVARRSRERHRRSRGDSLSIRPTTRIRAGRSTAPASTSCPRAPAPSRSGACRSSGGEAVQITDYPLDVNTFRFSSGGGRIALAMDVFPRLRRSQVHARTARRRRQEQVDRRAASTVCSSGTGTRGTMARARTCSSRRVNSDGRAGAPVNVSKSLDADVPSKPDGGDEEFTFSPDGARVVFSARVAGRGEAWSTNFDLYEAASDGASRRRNLTADNPAWDTQPVYLRNGDLAWIAMSRPGFEADRFRIKLMRGGRRREVAPQVGPFGRSISPWRTTAARCSRRRTISARRRCSRSTRAAAASPTSRARDTSAISPRRRAARWCCGTTSPRRPISIYWAPGANGAGSPPRTSRLLAQRTLGTFEQFSFAGWNDENGLRLRRESAGSREGPEVSDRVHRARRPAGQFPEPLELALERADVRGARLRHGVHRLPRIARLRPGVHRFDQPALGRPAVRRPEERVRRGTAEISRGSTANAPARSAPRTAATCRTGSRATGPTVSAAS